MVAMPASRAPSRPTAAVTWPANGMPSSFAAAASARNSSAVRPGWTLMKSYPAACCARTLLRASSGPSTELPFSEGPEVIRRGPNTAPSSRSWRNRRCEGRPSIPRIVVTPFATNKVRTLSMASVPVSGTWACISARPGSRKRSVPSTTAAPSGTGSVSTFPIALMRPSCTTTVWPGTTTSSVIGSTFTLMMAVVLARTASAAKSAAARMTSRFITVPPTSSLWSAGVSRRFPTRARCRAWPN